MRHRKVKNEDERIAQHNRYTVDSPKDYKGKWNELFDNLNDVYIEVGCGKGKFILTLAEQNLDKNYIAIEGRGSIILRALEKAAKKELRNIVFLKEYIKVIEEYFDKGEISDLYLNLNNPCTKY